MVTLEGELLEKSGAMTGGTTRKQGGRGFGAAVDDEIHRIRAHLSELQGEASTIEAGARRLTEEVDAKRAIRNEIDQKVARFGMFTEEFSRRFEAITVEKQTIEAAVARQQEETRNGASGLAALEAELDRATEVISGINAEIEGIKKRLDDTDIPALTEQMEKKRRGIEESERRLRNKDGDINDAQRERQHFSARLVELGGERERYEGGNRQIDADIAASNEQIAANRSQIAALEEKQKEFSGELDEPPCQAGRGLPEYPELRTEPHEVRCREGADHGPDGGDRGACPDPWHRSGDAQAAGRGDGHQPHAPGDRGEDR